jgi:tetratricopeptide (TPR) repeat protein
MWQAGRACAALPWLLVIIGLGCGGTLPAPAAPGAPPVRLVHGGGGPEVDRLLDVVYGGDFAPKDARALARAALAKYPDAGAAHEAAGYLATLADDPHETWLHFWKAAQDLDTPFTALYLWELSTDPTGAELDANIALYEAIRAGHPSPAARAAATTWKALALRRLGRLAEAAALARTLGYVEDWAVIGGFDNEDGKGFLTAFPPERGVDFATAVDGPLVPLSWQRVARLDLGAVVFGRSVWPQEASVAYLVTWVHADADADAHLCLSTSDAARAWVNGGLVLSEERVDLGNLDNLTVPVRLQRGWNQLLVKSAQKSGPWYLRARFTDASGSPFSGLTYAADPRPFRPAPDSLHDIEALTPQIERVLPPNRRAFLAARWSTRGGHLRRRQSELETLLGHAPGNLLAMFNLTLAYWTADEVGKAIDLGNRGVERGGTDAPAFLHFRARYYAQRHLYDKALADYVREIESTGAARSAERDLAELFKERGWRVDQCRRLEETAGKWPDDAAVVRELGKCQIALGYGSRGAATLKRAFDLEPGADKTIELLFDHALDESRLADARRWLTVLAQLDPTSPSYLVMGADLARHAAGGGAARSGLGAPARTPG